MNTKELGRLCVVGFVAGAVGVIAAGMMGQGTASTFEERAEARSESRAKSFPVIVTAVQKDGWALVVEPDGNCHIVLEDGSVIETKEQIAQGVPTGYNARFSELRETMGMEWIKSQQKK